MNAGALPPEHWLLDPVEGGGRLLGEGVHFFDMLRFLAGSDPVRVRSVSPAGKSRDEAIVALEFRDGSIGTVVYAGGGASGLGKERIEVFAGGASFVLDDYRSLEVHGLAKEGLKTRTIEKGQKEQLDNLHRALRGEAALGVTAEDGLQATWCAETAVARRRRRGAHASGSVTRSDREQRLAADPPAVVLRRRARAPSRSLPAPSEADFAEVKGWLADAGQLLRRLFRYAEVEL